MLITDYMEKNEMSAQELAEYCGVSRSSIYNAINGRAISIDLALLISSVTQGQVTVGDLNASPDGKLGRKKVATKT